jgi:hypothetical protein
MVPAASVSRTPRLRRAPSASQARSTVDIVAVTVAVAFIYKTKGVKGATLTSSQLALLEPA